MTGKWEGVRQNQEQFLREDGIWKPQRRVRRKSIPSGGHSKSQGLEADQHRTRAAQGKAGTAGFH